MLKNFQKLHFEISINMTIMELTQKDCTDVLCESRAK